VIDLDTIPRAPVSWRGAVRIIRSAWPPIDLFEDIADPADWPLLIAAEQKTNPRLMETIGNLDLVPQERWVAGAGASYLMAPFTHVSPDRPSRFSAGAFGVLYVADRFEVALSETIHHHALFMAATAQSPGWTSQFREIVLDVRGALHDLRGDDSALSRRSIPMTTAGSGPGRPAARRRFGRRGLSQPAPSRRPVRGPVLSRPGRERRPGPASGLSLGRDPGGPDPRAGDGEGVSGSRVTSSGDPSTLGGRRRGVAIRQPLPAGLVRRPVVDEPEVLTADLI
jgi:hypothetical protein